MFVGEKGALSPKWAAGTDDEMGGTPTPLERLSWDIRVVGCCCCFSAK